MGFFCVAKQLKSQIMLCLVPTSIIRQKKLSLGCNGEIYLDKIIRCSSSFGQTYLLLVTMVTHLHCTDSALCTFGSEQRFKALGAQLTHPLATYELIRQTQRDPPYRRTVLVNKEQQQLWGNVELTASIEHLVEMSQADWLFFCVLFCKIS